MVDSLLECEYTYMCCLLFTWLMKVVAAQCSCPIIVLTSIAEAHFLYFYVGLEAGDMDENLYRD